MGRHEGDGGSRFRARYAMGAFVLLAVLAFALEVHLTGARVEAEIAKLRARGEPVTFDALKPILAPGEPNAADWYSQAFALCQDVPNNISKMQGRDLQAKDLAEVRAFVAANRRFYALIDRATPVRQCVFSPWGRVDVYGPDYAPIFLLTRAKLQSYEGNADGALATCGQVFRLAEHLQQTPLPLQQARAFDIMDGASRDLGRVLKTRTPSPGSCRRLYQQLAAWRWSELWARAIRGERAAALDAFSYKEHGVLQKSIAGPVTSLDGLTINAYLTIGRPWSNADKARVLEFYNSAVAAHDVPPGRSSPGEGRRHALVQTLEKARSPLTHSWSLELYFLVKPTMRDQGAAELGAVQTALAVTAYRGEHRRYPATLADLERAGWKLPRDPFTQQPYRYQRRGQGFIVYSVGPDGRDDGGIAWTWQREEGGLPCDVVFEVGGGTGESQK